MNALASHSAVPQQEPGCIDMPFDCGMTCVGLPQLYLLFLFLRVLLSWFPAFGWDKQPWLALRQVYLL